MGRKSSIVKLDPRIQEAVGEAVREGRATIDEIVVLVRSMGGEVSRSAAGRYVKKASDQMRRYRDAQEIAKVWIGKLKDDPDSDVGRLLAEMVKTVAFQQLSDMGQEDGSQSSAMDLMLLAKALDHTSRSQRADLDRILRIRKEFAEKAAAAADQAVEDAKAAGASDALIETIKRRILGIADSTGAKGVK